jgi:CheY-like chemotaxis protein
VSSAGISERRMLPSEPGIEGEQFEPVPQTPSAVVLSQVLGFSGTFLLHARQRNRSLNRASTLGSNRRGPGLASARLPPRLLDHPHPDWSIVVTAARDTSAAPPANEETAGRQVMVAEDEPGVRRLTTRILQEAGYVVHEAKDGLEALEFVQAAPELLDVVVSDVVMPRLNGVELLQRLSSVCPDLPCILISGYGTPQLAALGITAPCGILPKPVPSQVLLDEVRRCLRQRT